MADLVYQKIIRDLKKQIFAGKYAPDMKLPDERSLAAIYQVSRSSVKRALAIMANDGIIFKKRGSGTFINPLYLENQSVFNYEGANLGITDNLQMAGKKPGIKLLTFDVVKVTEELARDLFLQKDDFVYRIKRLRLLDNVPFMIELSYLPIKFLPELNQKIAEESIFNFLQKKRKQAVTKAYLTISAAPSNEEDQQQLRLKPTEPVGIMAGIFFLDDGTPIEYSTMRLHYAYLKFNSFVSIEPKD
ncbi:GntR family transcriptional regulator [Loigolactobacillus iwatensis]|uniref:GntR family transcriptional regulator n=1 Tax=Loigolactobacillus iwatensis TaxID=1267156 RepID=UPI000F7E0F45|nr:GntR family transcriptional regulator [Loigolactobacillus iwatensis]